MLLSFAVTTITLVSCGNDTVEYTKEDLRALVFEDLTVDYDGQEHSIYIKDLPEGVEVTYTNNGQKLPGTYTIAAKVKYNDISINKTAKLTINSVESILTAPTEQTVYLYGCNFNLQYELNNTEQYLDIKYYQNGVALTESEIRKEGTYTVEIYAPKLTGYGDSNHVTITLHVINSKFDISFENAEFEADGTEKKIELTGSLPSGYTVTYENNTGTEAGNYYALAKINDANGQLVETHAATLAIKNPENVQFAEFLDEFFVAYLEGDQLSVNIFCENPADFGLEHYEASWYTYETYTEEDLVEAKQQFTDLLAELEEFKDAKLNNQQQIAYNNIYKFLNYYIDFYNIEDANLMLRYALGIVPSARRTLTW